MHKMKVSEDRLCFSLISDRRQRKGAFFFLLQSEEGDLYKITIEHEDEEVKALRIKYFDTVPVASGLCILKSGFLFVASEFGNQCVASFSIGGSPLTCRYTGNSINFKNLEMTMTRRSSVPGITPNRAWLNPSILFPEPISDHGRSRTWH